MLEDAGIWIGIIAGVVVIIGVIYGIFRGGFGIFAKINKIDRMEKGVDALLLLHADKLIELYQDEIKIVFNPTPSPYSEDEKNKLLQRLRDGYINHADAERLTQILKFEEEKAKEKDQRMAVLAIGALLLLIVLLSKD